MASVNRYDVEFAVLFPSDDGKSPKVASVKDIIQMVEENKQSIEKDFGGAIQSILPKNRPTGMKLYKNN